MLSNKTTLILSLIKFITFDVWYTSYVTSLLMYFNYKHSQQYKIDLEYEEKYGHMDYKPPREKIGCFIMCKDIKPSELYVRLNNEYSILLRSNSIYEKVRAASIIFAFQSGMKKCNRKKEIDGQIKLLNDLYAFRLMYNYNPLLKTVIETTYKKEH
jgi:hypothetical protein